jgi:hypothetical protein
MHNIFIQIAAYRDRELIPTVEDAIAHAKYPKRVSFGICWQYELPEELDYIEPLKSIENCRIQVIPARKSRGLGWARSQTEKLWRGERYTLQIDAHMRFADDWDLLAIEMLSMCPSEKPILSHYPPPYEPPRELISETCTRLMGGPFDPYGTIVPKYNGEITQDTPELGAFVAGGFMLADASIISHVPHDPHIYFTCTEVLYAARAWTNGWDIYYPHRPICWHYYTSSPGMRPLHWEDNKDYGELNQISQQRFLQILKMVPSTKNFSIYDLGKTRTLTDYEKISGVNFRQWRTKPELELLLSCLCTEINPTTSEQINTLLQQELDWNYLYEIAARYQVIPLLYSTIDNHFPAKVPKETFHQLQTDIYGNAKWNMLLTQELLSLINLFQSHEIRAIPVKGAVLAALAYGNLLLRQFGDLDMLIHPQDLAAATDLLVAHGYDRDNFDSKPKFSQPQRQIKLELHQTITPSYCASPLEFEHLWSRSTSVKIAGVEVPSLRAADALLILVAQNAQDLLHNQPRLGRLCDIAALIHTHQDLDWLDILTRAKLQGNQRILYFTLLLVADLFDTILPEQLQPAIESDSVANTLAKHWRSHLFAPEINVVWGSLFYLKIRDRWWDKLKYLIVPNSIDRLLLSLPGYLSYLYHPIRPFWLIYNYFLIRI